MRIRQVRPEFFTDPVTGRLRPETQLAYIGLWCVADDAGWLDWDVPQIGAVLYPYKSVHIREGLIGRAAEELVKAGRLLVMDCGCARIPTLEAHQRIGGTKSFTARERHQKHDVQTRMDLYARNGRVGNGRVGEGTHEADALGGTASRTAGEMMAAAGLKPSIVGRVAS